MWNEYRGVPQAANLMDASPPSQQHSCEKLGGDSRGLRQQVETVLRPNQQRLEGRGAVQSFPQTNPHIGGKGRWSLALVSEASTGQLQNVFRLLCVC